MTNPQQRWPDVGRAVTARMGALNIKQAELARRSKLSVPTVRFIMNGAPRGEPSPETLRAISGALGWTPDSIERILDGERPATRPALNGAAEPPSQAPTLAELTEIADKVVDRALQAISAESGVEHAALVGRMQTATDQVTDVLTDVTTSLGQVRDRLAAVEAAVDRLVAASSAPGRRGGRVKPGTR